MAKLEREAEREIERVKNVRSNLMPSVAEMGHPTHAEACNESKQTEEKKYAGKLA